MRQDTPRVTAPRDPAPQWPEGFLRVLRDAGAQEKNIPYCIGWVQRFFSKHPGRAEHELGRTEIEGFLSEIAAHPGINNWQVQQARNALELYYEKFRGIALSPRDAIPSDDITHPNHVGSETPPREPASKNFFQINNRTTGRVYNHPAENVNREILESGYPESLASVPLAGWHVTCDGFSRLRDGADARSRRFGTASRG